MRSRPEPWPSRLLAGSVLAWTLLWAVGLLLPSALGVNATARPGPVLAGLVLDGVLFCLATAPALLRRTSGGWLRRMPVGAQAVVTAVLVTVPGLPIGTLPVLLVIALGAVSVSGWVPPLVVVTALASVLAVRASGTSWSTAVWGSGLTVLLAGLLTYAFSRLGQVIAELRCAREELARVAVEAERVRFARDLHDLLGHSLSLIVVKAQAIRRSAYPDADEAAGHARDIEEIGRQALTEVRQAVRGYRTPSLRGELSRAVEALRAAGISAEVRQEHRTLSASQDELLGWVVREGVTNVIRHAQARHVVISTATGPSGSSVVISDDGSGATPEDDPGAEAGGAPGGTAGSGAGLLGLRERAQAVGGNVEATSGAAGFRLAAVVPPPAGGGHG